MTVSFALIMSAKLVLINRRHVTLAINHAAMTGVTPKAKMKKFKYGEEFGDKWDNLLTEEILLSAKAKQCSEHIHLMERKALEVADCMSFGSYSERLVFVDAFHKGYISAHCFNHEEEKLTITLSPLGKALE